MPERTGEGASLPFICTRSSRNLCAGYRVHNRCYLPFAE
nr:MAG TPA: hypothetical protein [Caudoviricetes sp.]